MLHELMTVPEKINELKVDELPRVLVLAHERTCALFCLLKAIVRLVTVLDDEGIDSRDALLLVLLCLHVCLLDLVSKRLEAVLEHVSDIVQRLCLLYDVR